MSSNILENDAPTADDRKQRSAPPLAPLDDMSDLKKIKKRFEFINDARIRRTQESLRQSQKDFIDFLPLLFHANHPMLPGYVKTTTPCGISNYQPTKASISAVKQFTKISRFERPPICAVHSIFIMGSIGTIAHSPKSDLDFWLCYNPNLPPDELKELKKKAVNIEAWAMSKIGLEIHFFFMDAVQFKIGEVLDLDSESSGTAQHHLLLEEFYRTGVFVAGRYPAWWLIPPEFEQDYDNCLQAIIKKRFIAEDDVIDFGGLAHIPAEEFYGAGLWQVYKGIDSPYKSILKILLIETYADEYPTSDLLCLRYKKAVYSGITELDKLDPYVMLIDKLESYLKKRNELERLDLIYRCFYLKINVVPSTPGRAGNAVGWRTELMDSLLSGWGWSSEQIADSNSHALWKGHRVLQERRLLIKELSNSYAMLSNFGSQYAKRVSENDVNILGRKLFSAIDTRPQKIDIIYRGITKDLLETHVTIELEKDEWFLRVRDPSREGREEEIKKSRSVVTIITWCYFNKIIGSNTMIALKKRTSFLDMKEVNAVIRCLRDFSPQGNIPLSSTEDLGKPAQIVNTMLFVNIGVDPMSCYNRSGVDLISNRGDVLSYGNSSFNLAVTLDLLVTTSWQEVFNYSFQNDHVLVNSLCQYLHWNIWREDVPLPPLPNIYSFSSTYSISLVRRISDIYRDVREFFLGVITDEKSKTERMQAGYRTEQALRYLLICGKVYYLLYIEGNTLNYLYKESFPDILRLLAEPRPQFTRTRFDQFALTNTPIPLLYKANRKNIVQLFYQVVGKNADIYILDENGSLFYQRTSFYDDNVLINNFDKFFVSALGERAVHPKLSTPQEVYDLPLASAPSPDSSGAGLPRAGIVFYRITNAENEFSLTEKLCSGEHNRYFSVRVNSKVEGNNTSYTFCCDDREFSSSQYGSSLFQEVANYLLMRRRGGTPYPVYITSIDLPPNALNNRTPNEAQMVDCLAYKKRIEDKLNERLNLTIE